MQDSQNPAKIPLPWASSAGPSYITYPVPLPSQIGVTNGAASFTDGFPPNSFVPYASGGAGPFGKDFNGLLKQTTAGLQWLQAGAYIPFDATFSTAIGGYPKGALIPSSVTLGLYWLNSVDNNNTNPDSGGSNWIAIALSPTLHGRAIFFRFGGVQQVSLNGAAFTTVGAGSILVPASGIFTNRQLWGGGAGGGGSSAAGAAGSGGGGGGYSEGYIGGLTPGASQTVTIGLGGTAGNGGGSPTDGGDGGTSTFMGMSATGGNHGSAANGAIASAFGTGGTGSGGALNYQGQSGNTAGLLPAGVIISAVGGGTYLVPPAVPGITGVLGNGGAGSYQGSGAGGGVNGGAGGLGSPGMLIVEW